MNFRHGGGGSTRALIRNNWGQTTKKSSTSINRGLSPIVLGKSKILLIQRIPIGIQPTDQLDGCPVTILVLV